MFPNKVASKKKDNFAANIFAVQSFEIGDDLEDLDMEELDADMMEEDEEEEESHPRKKVRT